MGIHAKSLNQLAHELEMGSRAVLTAQEPSPTPVVAAPSGLAKELAEFKKFFADLCHEPSAREVQETEAPEPPVPAEREATPGPAFSMDTTLGTRARAQTAEVCKRESALRPYSGFVSRGGITGEG